MSLRVLIPHGEIVCGSRDQIVLSIPFKSLLKPLHLPRIVILHISCKYIFPADWLSALPSYLLTIVFAFIWSCALFLLEAFRESHLLYKASYLQAYHSNIHYGSSAHRESPLSKEKGCSVARPEDIGSQGSLPGFPCVPKGIEECTLQSLEFRLRIPVGVEKNSFLETSCFMLITYANFVSYSIIFDAYFSIK